MSLINCKECGKEISDQAAACPNCGAPLRAAARKSYHVAPAVVVAAVVLFGWVYFFYPLVSVVDDSGVVSLPQSPLAPAPVVTRAEYNLIREGMTYARVREIIGAPGEELSRSDLAGFSTIMYSWANSNGSSMNAIFQNDALSTKAQFGLR